MLDFDTRAYGRIPDGQQLRALCEQHLMAKPAADAAAGDVLLMRFTRTRSTSRSWATVASRSR